MGLNISHGCWEGPYSAFHRYRSAVAKAAGYGDLNDYEGFSGFKTFPKDDPLTCLLGHSDSDGEIAAADTGQLAARLEDLLPALDAADAGGRYCGLYGDKTRVFIAGLRDAS